MQNDEMPEIGTDHIAEGVGNAKKIPLKQNQQPRPQDESKKSEKGENNSNNKVNDS